jgi:hypothetical protein
MVEGLSLTSGPFGVIRNRPKMTQLLARLDPQEREFVQLAYPEEFKQYVEAVRIAGESLIRKSEMIKLAAHRAPGP